MIINLCIPVTFGPVLQVYYVGGCIKHVNVIVYTNDTIRETVTMVSLSQVTLLYGDSIRRVSLYG